MHYETEKSSNVTLLSPASIISHMETFAEESNRFKVFYFKEKRTTRM